MCSRFVWGLRRQGVGEPSHTALDYLGCKQVKMYNSSAIVLHSRILTTSSVPIDAVMDRNADMLGSSELLVAMDIYLSMTILVSV